MTLVLDKFKLLLPKLKSSPSNWLSLNAPCCHHFGHNKDTRKRAGFKFDTGIIFNCFNCKFSAAWEPGRPLSNKFKSLCGWLGASDDEINELVFEALQTEASNAHLIIEPEQILFPKKKLPEGSLPVWEWMLVPESELGNKLYTQFISVVQYIIDRGFEPTSNKFYWSPNPQYSDRLIIPFLYNNKIVGNTARKVVPSKLRYLTDHHTHFVYNLDDQHDDHKYVFVLEGPLDAISVGGVALLTNNIADQQARLINNLGKKVIVIPDQDEAGLALIQKAIEYNWAVAFPTWDIKIKDAADAVKTYGKLFVIVDAIMSAVDNPIKIKMAAADLKNKLRRTK